MQNKGIVKFIACALMLVCIFYLSFSFVTRHHEDKAAAMGEEAGQEYLDSIMNEKVYCGLYSFKQCREMQIGLGLDLKGGMNVILEVSVPDVVAVLADHKTDPAFVKSMQEAKKEEEKSQADFITLFVKHYKQNAPGHRLAEIFATQQMKGKVSTQSSDGDVERALRAEVQSAVDNSFNVVRNRIDKFGVVQPNIQKLEGSEGRIMVEMPGIREPERVRKLLQGSANLEFWETYNSQEIVPILAQLNQKYAAMGDIAADTVAVADTVKSDTTVADTAAVKSGLAAVLGAKKDTKGAVSKQGQDELIKKQNPLFSVFQPVQGQGLSVVGYAVARDTAAVNKIIYSDVAAQLLPSDLKLIWGAKPAEFDTKATIYELYAIKVTEPSGRAPLEGDVIVSASDGPLPITIIESALSTGFSVGRRVCNAILAIDFSESPVRDAKSAMVSNVIFAVFVGFKIFGHAHRFPCRVLRYGKRIKCKRCRPRFQLLPAPWQCAESYVAEQCECLGRF